MADLTDVYAALQKADAAGDTAGAKQLADYIRTQGSTHQYGTGKSFDTLPDGSLALSNSPEAAAARSPVSGNSFLQNALIGSGKFDTDLGLGARQVYATVADAISPRQPTLSSLITGPQSRLSALQNEAAQKRQTDQAIMQTAGGKAGQIGTGVLTAIPLSAIPGVGTYLGAGAIGAGFGLLTPTTANESRLLNTGIGGALGIAGQGTGNLLSRWLATRAAPAAASQASSAATATIAPSSADAVAAASGNISARATGGGYNFGSVGSDPIQGLTAAQTEAAAQGAALGMRMTPGQSTGSRALLQLEAKLESQPMTSGPFNTIKAANQQAVNRAWAGAIGEQGHAVDSATLAQASDRLGQVFENVRTPNNIAITNPSATSRALDSIDQDVRGLLPGNGSIRDNPLVADVEALSSQGSINGEQLGSLSSKLGRAAAKQMTTPGGDRDWGNALFQVKNHVDDMIQSTLSGEEATAYGSARQQYRALMQLTARTGNVNPSTGNVSGSNMANFLQQTDKRGYLFGNNQSPAYNAVRFAQAFKPIVGDSGTATRMPLPSVSQFVIGGAMNLGTRAYLRSGGAGLAAAANAGSTAAGAIRDTGSALGALPGVQTALPYLRSGLPGLGGGLVPYLSQ